MQKAPSIYIPVFMLVHPVGEAGRHESVFCCNFPRQQMLQHLGCGPLLLDEEEDGGQGFRVGRVSQLGHQGQNTLERKVVS